MCRTGNCQPPGARRAGQDRAAPKGSLDAPEALTNNLVPERRNVPATRAGKLLA